MPKEDYAPVRRRCDWHARGRTNAIGALLGGAVLVVALFQGAVNADVFHAWVTQDLLPRLSARAVLVMDNAAFHKRADIREAIAAAGHTLARRSCPRTPDLNPIERKWAQAIRRRTQCSIDELFAGDGL